MFNVQRFITRVFLIGFYQLQGCLGAGLRKPEMYNEVTPSNKKIKIKIHPIVFLLCPTKSNPFHKMKGKENYWEWNKVNSCHQAIWGEVSKKKQKKETETKLSATNKTWTMVTSPDFSPTYLQLKMDFPLPYTHLTTEGKIDLNNTGWKKKQIKFPKIFHYLVFQPKLLFFKYGHGREQHRNWRCTQIPYVTACKIQSQQQEPLAPEERLLSSQRVSFCFQAI